MTTSYTPAPPGTWLLLVTDEAVLYTQAPTAGSVVELWKALGSDAPVQVALDILTRSGLGSAPSFALGHVVAGSLHALVRGPLVLEASAAGSAESIDGTGVSTWRETTVAGVTALRLGDSAGGLPVGSGAVWASGFAFYPAAAPAAAQPEPTAVEPTEDVAPTLPAEHTVVEHTIVEAEEVQPPADAEVAYSHLFEETVHRSIEEAAIREEPEGDDAVPAAPAAEVLGDHDGETVMSADIAALRARKRAATSSAPAVSGHSIYLELPDNQREPLVQPVIIGRSPSVSQVSGAELPRLVSVPGNQDISRSHARFALEGGTVVVTDLHSRNGTSITLPGKAKQLLRKGEPTAVLPGTVVDLGGVISLTVREA